MAKPTESYAERARAKLRKKAENAKKGSADPREWIPSIGVHRIRILPPIPFSQDTYNNKGELVGKKGEEDESFYMTHAFHYFEDIGKEGKGKFVWSKRHYEKNDKQVKDPADVVVEQLYETARKEKNEALKSIASKIKRKRHFFANIILYNEEGPVFKILKDTSNEGKLIKQVCFHATLPFFRDVQDEWLVEESVTVDEDQITTDLLSVDVGHDFKIKKTKTGNENWDFSYDTSIPFKNERPLTKEEIDEFMSQRVDLRNYVEYAELDAVQEALDEYFEKVDGVEVESDDDDETPAPTKTKTKTPAKVVEEEEEEEVQVKKVVKPAKKKVVEEDDDVDESILDDLDDDEE